MERKNGYNIPHDEMEREKKNTFNGEKYILHWNTRFLTNGYFYLLQYLLVAKENRNKYV